jgi:glycosyltransferase involved in cell wall biosynthesis
MSKTNMLISSLDNKFFEEIIDSLKEDYNVEIDLFHENNDKTRHEMLERADIVICEWCEANALWFSKHKKHQKLFIRLHKYELWTSFFYNILWNNVDNLIFIAPEMKRLANKHHIQRKFLREQNFDWEFYLNNNDVLFSDLPMTYYNKEWAFDHWNKIGCKMDWNIPNINLTDESIDYESVCDEFKHFNGGTLIFNYVKSNMFKELPKCEDNKFNIGIMGILPKIKRLDIAIDIIEMMIKKDKRYKLYILGKWYTDWNGTKNNQTEIAYFKSIEQRIKLNKLSEHVIFEEFTDSPDIWLQKIGYLLSVSDVEGSHQAVAEAMATGTIPFIYGKALTTYKLDNVYPKKYSFYEDTVDNLCDKI